MGSMEVQQVLHMNGGDGETSYAKNSASQNKIINMAKPILEEAILDLDCTTFHKSMGIADLGCSAGPNTLLEVSEIMNIVDRKCRQLDRLSPEFQVFLNDLPGNDFNTVFESLPTFHEKLREEKGEKFGPCFIAGVPGSFYGRLFPSRSLHFVHSSSSLHWLSKVPAGLNEKEDTPLNKGKIYISKTSPPAVFNAYLTQFQSDFSLFLSSRSEEIISGGRMVLSLRGRRTADASAEESCLLWDLLAQAMRDLVLEGFVEEKKLDSFNAPYYDPSPEEIKSEIQKEGSFALDRFEIVAIDWDGVATEAITLHIAKATRAVSETMLRSHFGEEIMDRLFQRFRKLLGSTKGVNHITLVMSLIRNA